MYNVYWTPYCVLNIIMFSVCVCNPRKGTCLFTFTWGWSSETITIVLQIRATFFLTRYNFLILSPFERAQNSALLYPGVCWLKFGSPKKNLILTKKSSFFRHFPDHFLAISGNQPRFSDIFRTFFWHFWDKKPPGSPRGSPNRTWRTTRPKKGRKLPNN